MRSVSIFFLIFLLLPASHAFCATPGSAGKPAVRSLDRLVARVNSEPITELEVQSLLVADPKLDYSAALDALIDQRLVLSWARQNNIAVSQGDIVRTEKTIMQTNNIPEDRFEEVLAARGQDREAFRDGLRDQILVNKALSVALEPAMRIDETKIQKRYEELYPPEKTFTMSHILLKPDAAGGKDETFVRGLAEEIMDQIRKGTSFEDMARKYSADETTSGQGGFLGSFKVGELFPELEKLALELEPGEVGGPVQTSMGFHILKLEDKGITQPPPLSQVRDRIRAGLISQSEAEIRQQWLKELKEKAFIEVFTDGE